MATREPSIGTSRRDAFVGARSPRPGRGLAGREDRAPTRQRHDPIDPSFPPPVRIGSLERAVRARLDGSLTQPRPFLPRRRRVRGGGSPAPPREADRWVPRTSARSRSVQAANPANTGAPGLPCRRPANDRVAGAQKHRSSTGAAISTSGPVPWSCARNSGLGATPQGDVCAVCAARAARRASNASRARRPYCMSWPY